MATLIKKGTKKAGGAKASEAEFAEPTPPPMEAEAPAPHDAGGHGTEITTYQKPPQPPGPPVDTTPFLTYPAAYEGPLPPNFPRSYGSNTPYDVGATYAPPSGAGDFQLPGRYIPAEPPPSREPPAPPSGGLLSRVLLFTGETTAAERDRVAAEEFEAAIAPVMEYMRAAAPEASTPEEAARIWSENQGEITPDPKGGSYVPGDSFDRDARVYYRLLRRNYEATPRPSERRKESRALSRPGGADGYRLLPGTRGW
jgi:hypothetical protein